MRGEALFLNGVFESVLEEILKVQAQLPEQIMFLQPYSSRPIRGLRDSPPSVDDPVLVLISTTTNLDQVSYVAEIVGWDDKTTLGTIRWRVFNRLIVTLQPDEGGLYDNSQSVDGQSLNLLHIRRTRRLQRPFTVTRLIKATDSSEISGSRTTSGGWAYVKNENLTALIA